MNKYEIFGRLYKSYPLLKPPTEIQNRRIFRYPDRQLAPYCDNNIYIVADCWGLYSHTYLGLVEVKDEFENIPDFVFARILGEWRFVIFQSPSEKNLIIAHAHPDFPDWKLEMDDFSLVRFIDWVEMMKKQLDKWEESLGNVIMP